MKGQYGSCSQLLLRSILSITVFIPFARQGLAYFKAPRWPTTAGAIPEAEAEAEATQEEEAASTGVMMMEEEVAMVEEITRTPSSTWRLQAATESGCRSRGQEAAGAAVRTAIGSYVALVSVFCWGS